MTKPLYHIIIILFGKVTEGGNGLLVKACKSRIAGGLDFTIENRIFASPV